MVFHKMCVDKNLRYEKGRDRVQATPPKRASACALQVLPGVRPTQSAIQCPRGPQNTGTYKKFGSEEGL